MKKFLFFLSLLFLVVAGQYWHEESVIAQQAQTCPTRPIADSSNACATTAFVHNLFATLTPTGTVTSVASNNCISGGTITTTGTLGLTSSCITDTYVNSLSATKSLYTPSGTGGQAQTVAVRLGQAVYIGDYCSSSALSANATACFANAMTAACASTGAIYINKSAKFTGSITAACDGLALYFSSWNVVFTFANGSSYDFISNGKRDLYIVNAHFVDSGKSGGTMWDIENSYNFIAIDTFSDNAYNGIYVNNCNTVEFRGGVLNLGSGSTFGVRLYAVPDGSHRTDVVQFWQFVIQANYVGADGLQVDGDFNTLRWFGGSILSANYAVLVQNSGNSATHYPSALFFYGLEADGEKNQSVLIQGGKNIEFIGGDLSNTSTAPTTGTPQGGLDGATFQCNADAAYSVTSNIKITGTRISNSRVMAAYIDCKDVDIAGASFSDASKAGVGAYVAVEFGPHADRITWAGGSAGCRIGESCRVNYGIQVDSGGINMGIGLVAMVSLVGPYTCVGGCAGSVHIAPAF